MAIVVWVVFAGALAFEDYSRSHGGDPVEALAWAESRFEVAGLDLPAFKVDLRSDACRPGARAQWDGATVSLCSEGSRMHWTLLHELAHVWATTNLTAADEQRLLEEWGTPAWFDPAVPHDDRGGEQFADMIAWALYPIRIDDCCTLTADQMLRSLASLGITPLWK